MPEYLVAGIVNRGWHINDLQGNFLPDASLHKCALKNLYSQKV